ncbi:MAG: DUF3820 family protein [Parcubacteria group bacterium]|jgi:uncharacterized protein (DUF3820 family)
MPLTDESPMPWGMHQGKQMMDVPADYLVWLYENNKVNGDVKRYIESNMDTLKLEIEQKKKRSKH